MVNIFWFRRDLRLHDNAALYHALKSGKPVLCLFIFDRGILDKLQDRGDLRVNFIHSVLGDLAAELQELGSGLLVKYGSPADVWKEVVAEFDVHEVFANHDYEPYARRRDELVAGVLAENGTGFRTFKDQVIFEKSEVLSATGKPYAVYTPYARAWMAKCNDFYLRSYPVSKYLSALHRGSPSVFPSLEDIGFQKAAFDFPSKEVRDGLIENYHRDRDYPALPATTRMGLHLRFGTVSIRELARRALKLNETYLKELIWREFFMQVLWHHPNVENESFKKQYDRIAWRNNEKEFGKWCEGKTGYPIVDAGMRELNATGFMHNRVRMITGSFLTKHLLIDWRWGEAYFAEKLLDYDLAANNGNWQWVAGTGCDSAPYFRIFNPSEQAKKFDAGGKYIRRWVPEIDSLEYLPPMVDHKMARERALAAYKKALADQS